MEKRISIIVFAILFSTQIFMVNSQKNDESVISVEKSSIFTKENGYSCPEGTVLSNMPDGSLGYPSTEDFDFKNYTFFSNLPGGEISEISLWGLQAYHDGENWNPCTSNIMDIEVTFYEDDDGKPGDVIASEIHLVPAIEDENVNFGTWAVYSFTIDLDDNVSISEGWFSFWSKNNPNCWLLIINSETGVGKSGYFDQFDRFYTRIYPSSFCLVSEEPLGVLEGTVENTLGNPLEDVEVSVGGYPGYTTFTDELGNYEIPNIIEGTHEIEFNKFEYSTFAEDNVIIDAGETTTLNATLDLLSTLTISGFVSGSDAPATGIQNASIELKGYSEANTNTNADGEFEIENVYANQEYTIFVNREKYHPYSENITTEEEDIELEDILLELIPFPVSKVKAEEDGNDALITWEAPSQEITEFRYDDGFPVEQLGSTGGTLNSILGNAHHRSAELHEIAWVLTNEGGLHESIKVWVLGLTPYGAPDKDNILYTAEDVPNINNQWNTYQLSEPVYAPHGFFIGLSYEGFIGLAVDNGRGEPWNFKHGTQFFNPDITSTETDFRDISVWGFNVNYLLRGYGFDFGEIKTLDKKESSPKVNKTKLSKGKLKSDINPGNPKYNTADSKYDIKTTPESFNIYRLLKDDWNNKAEWVELETEHDDWEYTDNDWETQEMGIYKYAVEAIYPDDAISTPALSNPLPKDMSVSFTVSITTNSGDEPEGAIVNLVNTEEPAQFSYTMESPASGEVIFDEVWKGHYDLTINLNGFKEYHAEDIDITEEGSYSVELIEDVVEPFGLDVEIIQLEPGKALFSWNNIFGTFLFEDFEEGELPEEWDTIVNNDEITGAMPSTWTVNNYSTENFSPFGNYHIGLMSSINHQNEWLISPEITVGKDFELEFWTVAFYGSNYNDHYYVKISNDGGNNWDILWDASEKSGGWNYYEHPVIISLDDYAEQDVYIAFNAVDGPTDDGLWYYWFIDNISIGADENKQKMEMSKFTHNSKDNKAFYGFSVFLNDTDTPIETDYMDTEILFTDLAIGEDHYAGVQSFYTTGNSDIVTIDFYMPEYYNVTYEVIGDNGNLTAEVSQGEMVSGDPVAGGTDISFIADPDDGYVVKEWTVNGDIVEENGEEDIFVYENLDKEIHVTVEFEEGVSVPVIEEDVLLIYPNPAKDKFIIEAPYTIKGIKLYNINGQLVIEKTEDTSQSEINVSNLPSGIYFIHVETINQTFNKKVKIAR